MNNAGVYRKKAAKVIGVHPHTLIRWEERGLVRPTRNYNNWRVYQLEEVLRLREMVQTESQLRRTTP
jgi:DNA-binding transcriptional MerR regulator